MIKRTSFTVVLFLAFVPPVALAPAFAADLPAAAGAGTTVTVKAQMKEQRDRLKAQQSAETAKLKADQKAQRDKLKADQRAQRDKLKEAQKEQLRKAHAHQADRSQALPVRG